MSGSVPLRGAGESPIVLGRTTHLLRFAALERVLAVKSSPLAVVFVFLSKHRKRMRSNNVHRLR